MQRITISLPDDLAQAVEREAKRRGTSVSAIAREALAGRLGPGSGGERNLSFAALGRSGKSDTASRAEEILSEEWSSARGR